MTTAHSWNQPYTLYSESNSIEHPSLQFHLHQEKLHTRHFYWQNMILHERQGGAGWERGHVIASLKTVRPKSSRLQKEQWSRKETSANKDISHYWETHKGSDIFTEILLEIRVIYSEQTFCIHYWKQAGHLRGSDDIEGLKSRQKQQHWHKTECSQFLQLRTGMGAAKVTEWHESKAWSQKDGLGNIKYPN